MYRGVSIRLEMATFYLRDEMAIVPQQPALFSNNVYHNIRYGNPSATDEEVVAALMPYKKLTRRS